MSLQSPISFGRYRLLRVIGRGGEATVHLAEDPVLARQVALKIFPRAVGTDGTKLPAGFHREVEVLSRLRHPGICAVHDAGVHDGCAFIAMTYVEGRSLADAPAPDAAEATRIARQLAGIVDAAHHVGVVHGDLKPANILVTPEGRCVVLDFGVARILDAEAPFAPPRRAGTLPYLAPECLTQAPDTRSDVYGLAAVIFEIVARRPPFSAPTRAAVLERLRTDDVPLLRSVRPGVSKDLEAVLAKGLDRDPARRYASMADFGSDLEQLCQGAPVSARKYGAVGRALRWAGRNRAAAALIAVAFGFLSIWAVVAAKKTRDLEDQLSRKRAEAGRAAREHAAAEEHLLRYERIADRRRIRDLESRAERLVPPSAALVGSLRSWLSDAEPLVRRLTAHRLELEDVRARGQLERAPGRPREIEELNARLARLDAGSPAARSLRRCLERLEASHPAVERRVYASDADAWHDAALSALVGAFEQFTDGDRGTIAAVTARVHQAQAVEESLAANAAAWDRARRSIADRQECPRYDGLVIAPQVGLVPLRRDAASGLWEFLHVLTGEAPGQGPRGDYVVTAETGVVLALVPGGIGRMGARRPAAGEAAGPHVDPMASPDESPLDDVPLDPFFISKFEMTEAQWVRGRGDDPPAGVRPQDRSGRLAPTLPAAWIDWNDAVRALWRLGLELPTEAQWEYAARAGTTTPWWTGGDPSTLEGAAVFSTVDVASVGGRVPNAFGLHDVAGNVAEWCRDVFARYEAARFPGTGERSGLDELEHRMSRGGGCRGVVHELRSAARAIHSPATRLHSLGVRPARPLDR